MHRGLLKQKYSFVSLGILSGLGISIFFELQGVKIAFGILFVLLGLMIGSTIAHHFCFHHDHEGDSLLDKSFIALLFGVNFFHPMVDGFVLGETIRLSAIIGFFILIQVVMHEFIRQTALYEIFKKAGFSYKKLLTVLVVGFSIGLALSFVGSNFLGSYEWIVDFVTLFAYSVVVSEYFTVLKTNKQNIDILYIGIGLMLGVVLSFLG